MANKKGYKTVDLLNFFKIHNFQEDIFKLL